MSDVSRYREEARYDLQAATYDASRSASPTVAWLLLKFLGEGRGRTVLDVAGGTGNYAEVLRDRGFGVFVLDREPAMLARSVPKVGAGRQVVADVHALPVRVGAADAAICVRAMHQFPDPLAA